uniref:Uncharacterized protein n=2 Tax=Panagrolaimus sp. JU765 TaxID=591449 RepID=A0AC34QYB6_9BILA
MYAPLKYPDGRDFPMWAEIFGFCLSGCSMICIPAYAIYYMLCQNTHLSFKEKWQKGIHPPRDLGLSTRPFTREEEMEFIDKGGQHPEQKNNNSFK